MDSEALLQKLLGTKYIQVIRAHWLDVPVRPNCGVCTLLFVF